MSSKRRPFAFWSDNTIDNNGGTANRGEGSLTSSSASTERQTGPNLLQSGGTRDERSSAGASGTAGEFEGSSRDPKEENSVKRDDSWDTRSRNQSKGQGLNDNCQELSKKRQRFSDKDQGLSQDLASRTSLDKDFDSVDSWEFVGNTTRDDVGNSDASISFGTPRYNNSAKGSNHDMGIGSMGGGPRCGTARRETKVSGSPKDGNKSSIDKQRSGEACNADCNSRYSSKNTNNMEKIETGSEKSRGKMDAESGHKNDMTRSPKRRADREFSDGGASSVGSESGDDSESSVSSCESDNRNRSDDSGGDSDDDKSCDGLKNSVGRKFSDQENKCKINGSGKGSNSGDRGSNTARHGYSTYEPGKYSKKQSSRDVVEAVNSQNPLSRDGGAISKYSHGFSGKNHRHGESDWNTDTIYQDEVNPRSNTAKDKVENSNETPKLPIGKAEYMWQFQNEHGSWITYGQSNSEGVYPTSSRVTSDDIENYYLTDPEKIPLLITTGYNSYVLNFQTMTQTNEKTNVRRKIRRVPKQEAVDTLPPKQHGSPFSGFASEERHAELDLNSAAGSVIRQYNQGNGISTQETIPVAHEWQFEDELGKWITFGQSSAALGLDSFSTTSTDDIEKFFITHPDKLMPIQTHYNDYTLNFKTMTQMNEKTRVQRRIRRVPKLNSWMRGLFIGGFHMFLDYVRGTKSSTSNSENGNMQYTGIHQHAITSSKPMSVSGSTTVEYLSDCNTYVDTYLGNISQTQDTRTTATVGPVLRSAASGEQRNLANWAGSNAERSQSRFALPASNNNIVADSSYLNRGIHGAELPHGAEAASIGFENFHGGVHACGRTSYGGLYATNHGASNPTGFPGNNLAHFPSTSTPHDMVGVRYVWQFQDELGVWITYGQPNSTGNFICTTSATSDEIERHYSIHQTSKPMIIQSSYNRYVLDFQTMTQTNERTLVQRPFRRVPYHLSRE